MEWQRRERLTIARDRLLRGDRVVNITDLSVDLEFMAAKSFSLHYMRHFGETPKKPFTEIICCGRISGNTFTPAT
jgi:hypothetical protein